MTVLVLAGAAVVFVLIVVLWSRASFTRSERRAMKSHRRALSLLGDVTKRSQAAALITPVLPEQASRDHIRIEGNVSLPSTLWASEPPKLEVPDVTPISGTSAGNLRRHHLALVLHRRPAT